MRILMDGYWWHDGPQAARTVQRELVLAWARAFPEDEVVVALRRDAETDDLPARAEVVRTRLWPHAASNRWELPLLAAGAGTELAVCHNYTPAAGPSLLFLHDVMFEEHPEWFSLAERLYFSAMLPWARRAALVATSTRTEADRIARHAPSLPQSIVTGLGVPPSLDAEPRRPSRVPAGSKFAVTVGRLNVRKNLETAMLAAVHSARISPEHPLYVVGGTAHSGVGVAIPDAARALLDDGSIVLLGQVPDDELAWLYANASLTIALSLDEGFGMPAVEAARFGSPLVASDIPVFRETVEGYAVFAPPLDALATASALDAAWGHRPDVAARERTASRFSWDAAARSLRAAADVHSLARSSARQQGRQLAGGLIHRAHRAPVRART